MLKSTGGQRAAVITPGAGTGITVNNFGSVGRSIYKVTMTFAGFAAAALTADLTIATLPAKTRLMGIVSDTTATYTGGAVATAALIIGKSVGGAEYIASHDVFTAPITKGLADADFGSALTRAAAIQGGDMPSWTTTTIVSARITTTVGNANALTTGSTTVYLICETYP